MTIEDLQKICTKHKGVTPDIKWGYHLCFSVGGKMFLIDSPDEVPVSTNCSVSAEYFPKKHKINISAK